MWLLGLDLRTSGRVMAMWACNFIVGWGQRWGDLEGSLAASLAKTVSYRFREDSVFKNKMKSHKGRNLMVGYSLYVNVHTPTQTQIKKLLTHLKSTI